MKACQVDNFLLLYATRKTELPDNSLAAKERERRREPAWHKAQFACQSSLSEHSPRHGVDKSK